VRHARRFRVAPRRFSVVLCVLAVAALTFVAAAYATDVTYAPYKYWFPGDQTTGNFDSSGHRWYADSMLEKSCGGLADCWGRVAFVLSGGSWVYSYTDQTSDTFTGISTGDPYWDSQKKPLCRNNAAFSSYYAECIGGHY
jgi:hypothetical protein